MTNNTLPILRPIHVEFRAARSLCRRLSASDLSKQIKPKDVPALASTSSSSFNQSTVVLPPSPKQFFKKSSAQVAVLVGPKPCGLKPKGSTKKKRPSPLSIRASEEQKKILQEKAWAAAIPVGRYVLAAALGSDYKPPANPELTKALLMLSRELTAQGNNLNQVAKHVNMGKASPDECDGMLGILGRSMLQTHRAVRKALNEEPMP